MLKNLTNSHLDRQNILNNPFAVEAILEQTKLKSIVFDDQIWFTTEQVANYFEVTTRTIQNYLENYEQELRQNGYKIFTGKELEIAKSVFGNETDFTTKTTVLGMFNFRSFLNLGMLLTNSEKAKQLRSLVLDIVIGVMNQKYGQNRKFINQNDALYPFAISQYQNYHQKLNDSLRDCVEMGNTKYIYFNDKIYKFLFLEKYKEYKILLDLKSKEKPINTHYSEVITTISTFETAFAEEIREKSQGLNRKINKTEAETIFDKLIRKQLWQPLLHFSREIIASRDLGFRNILHPNLGDQIKPISAEEYQRFISQASLQNPLTEAENQQITENQTQDLFEQIEQDKNIYKRLKNK